jgi:signal transduction histidine kinase/CheY-like chemotaxis protein
MLLKVLHKIGLTNLTDEQINKYEAYYNKIREKVKIDILTLKLFHFIGMTNLNDSNIEEYETFYLKNNSTSNKDEFSSQLKKLTDELKTKNEELVKTKKILEENNKILEILSHEFRTPANAIIGFSELLNQKDIKISQVQNYASIIKSNSDKLLALINSILDFSKIGSNQFQLNPIEYSLNDQFSSLFYNFNRCIIEMNKKIELKYIKNLDDDKSHVFADKYLIDRVVKNLLDNAIKFTNQGQIEFGYKKEKSDKLIVFVKDTGLGIPATEYSYIFNKPLRSINLDSDQYTGLGIGLYLSKKFVELMSGEIWFESKINKGSSFYFTIPFSQNIDSQTKKKTLKSSKLKTILIAEDNDDLFNYINDYITNENLNIIRARNGLEAVNIIEYNRDIDLIIMDILMPTMDGYEASRIIRSKNINIPIIALTQSYTKELDATFEEYLSKPFPIKYLVDKINNYLVKDEKSKYLNYKKKNKNN